jgi:hypothetical protein
MDEQEKRAFFLSGAAVLTVAEVRAWAEEIKPGVWQSIPQASIEDEVPLIVSVMNPPTL